MTHRKSLGCHPDGLRCNSIDLRQPGPPRPFSPHLNLLTAGMGVPQPVLPWNPRWCFWSEGRVGVGWEGWGFAGQVRCAGIAWCARVGFDPVPLGFSH